MRVAGLSFFIAGLGWHSATAVRPVHEFASPAPSCSETLRIIQMGFQSHLPANQVRGSAQLLCQASIKNYSACHKPSVRSLLDAASQAGASVGAEAVSGLSAANVGAAVGAAAAVAAEQTSTTRTKTFFDCWKRENDLRIMPVDSDDLFTKTWDTDSIWQDTGDQQAYAAQVRFSLYHAYDQISDSGCFYVYDRACQARFGMMLGTGTAPEPTGLFVDSHPNLNQARMPDQHPLRNSNTEVDDVKARELRIPMDTNVHPENNMVDPRMMEDIRNAVRRSRHSERVPRSPAVGTSTASVVKAPWDLPTGSQSSTSDNSIAGSKPRLPSSGTVQQAEAPTDLRIVGKVPPQVTVVVAEVPTPRKNGQRHDRTNFYCVDGDTNGDTYNNTCKDYVGNEAWCGRYDHVEFQSKTVCCACGGGSAQGRNIASVSNSGGILHSVEVAGQAAAGRSVERQSPTKQLAIEQSPVEQPAQGQPTVGQSAKGKGQTASGQPVEPELVAGGNDTENRSTENVDATVQATAETNTKPSIATATQTNDAIGTDTQAAAVQSHGNTTLASKPTAQPAASGTDKQEPAVQSQESSTPASKPTEQPAAVPPTSPTQPPSTQSPATQPPATQPPAAAVTPTPSPAAALAAPQTKSLEAKTSAPYKQMDYGQMCVSGCEITTVEECSSALAALKLPPIGFKSSSETFPPHCSVQGSKETGPAGTGGCWNSDPTGATRYDLASICRTTNCTNTSSTSNASNSSAPSPAATKEKEEEEEPSWWRRILNSITGFPSRVKSWIWPSKDEQRAPSPTPEPSSATTPPPTPAQTQELKLELPSSGASSFIVPDAPLDRLTKAIGEKPSALTSVSSLKVLTHPTALTKAPAHVSSQSPAAVFDPPLDRLLQSAEHTPQAGASVLPPAAAATPHSGGVEAGTSAGVRRLGSSMAAVASSISAGASPAPSLPDELRRAEETLPQRALPEELRQLEDPKWTAALSSLPPSREHLVNVDVNQKKR